MHEMSLAESVRGIIDEAAAAQGIVWVRTVVLEIGALAAVEVEALRFCLDVVLAGSVAEGAGLRIESVPGEGVCAACAQRSPMQVLYEACPHCGAYAMRMTGGNGMRVLELEVSGQ